MFSDGQTKVYRLVLLGQPALAGSSVADNCDNSTSSDLPGGFVLNGCSIGKISIHVRKHDRLIFHLIIQSRYNEALKCINPRYNYSVTNVLRNMPNRDQSTN